MGEAMAGHLLDAGHELTVHNRTRERESLWPREAPAGRDAARGRPGRGSRVPLRLGFARRRGRRAWPRWHRRGHRARGGGAGLLDDRARHLAPRGDGARRARGRGGRRTRLRGIGGRAQGSAHGVRRRGGRARRSRAPCAGGVLPLITHLGRPRCRSGRQSRQSGADLGHLRGARRRARAGRAARACRWRRSSRRWAAGRRARGSSRTAPAT